MSGTTISIRAGGWLFLGLVCVGVGRLSTSGSVRTLSLGVLALALLGAAQLEPKQLLWVVLALNPLPFYMHAIHASLTIFFVIALWMSILASRASSRLRLGSLSGYVIPLAAVVTTLFLALSRGESDRTGADALATGQLIAGVALFAACLLLITSPEAVDRAFRALGVAAALVLAITLVQLLLPNLPVPGLLAGSGSVQTDLQGIHSNLRVAGPIGDYELASEFFGLVGAAAAFFATRSIGVWRVFWFALIPLATLVIAMSSTRSGFGILVIGVIAAFLVSRGTGRRQLLLAVAACTLAFIPLLRVLQSHLSTGFIFERFATTQTGGGLASLLDRASVWPRFVEHLPHGWNLWLGHGVAYDYPAWGTYPHSLPLTLVFTVGVAGGIAFYSLIGVVAMRCFAASRRTGWITPAFAGIMVCLFVLNEVKIEYLRQPGYEMFIWGLLGIAAASGQVAKGLTHDEADAPNQARSGQPRR